MLLTEDKIYTLLRHPDEFVSEHAFRWFCNSLSTRIDILPVLLEVSPQTSWTYRTPHTLYSGLAVDGQTLPHLLTLLQNCQEDGLKLHLSHGIANAPADALRDVAERLDTTPNLSAQAKARCKRKLSLQSMSTRELWSETLRYCCDEPDESIAPLAIRDMASLLGAKSDLPRDDVLEAFRDSYWKDSWVELATTYLVGFARIEQAREGLLATIRNPFEECLNPAAEESLARLGLPQRAESFRKFWRSGPDDYRLSLVHIFCSLPTAKSEQMVLQALELERDPTVRTVLCIALCDLYSDQAIDRCLHEIQNGYDEQMDRLEDCVLVLADSLGAELPQAEAWRNDRLKREKSYQATFQRVDSRRIMEDRPPTIPELSMAEQAPVTAKVDRNASCPCGSGKKYKKCCGRG